jgi:hypothetical protein
MNAGATVGPKRNRIEHEHQSAFFSWLRLNQRKFPELKRFFAIPNGGARSHATAISLFLEGVRPGVLDTYLPLRRQGKTGLWIEFKAPGGSLSQEQREEILALEAEGHLCKVVFEWTDAAHITADYLDLNIPIPPAPAPAQKKRRRQNASHNRSGPAGPDYSVGPVRLHTRIGRAAALQRASKIPLAPARGLAES